MSNDCLYICESVRVDDDVTEITIFYISLNKYKVIVIAT